MNESSGDPEKKRFLESVKRGPDDVKHGRILTTEELLNFLTEKRKTDKSIKPKDNPRKN